MVQIVAEQRTGEHSLETASGSLHISSSPSREFPFAWLAALLPPAQEQKRQEGIAKGGESFNPCSHEPSPQAKKGERGNRKHLAKQLNSFLAAPSEGGWKGQRRKQEEQPGLQLVLKDWVKGADWWGHGERYSCVMASYLNAVMAIILIHIFQATFSTELSTLNIHPVFLPCSSLLLCSPLITKQIFPLGAVECRLLSRQLNIIFSLRGILSFIFSFFYFSSGSYAMFHLIGLSVLANFINAIFYIRALIYDSVIIVMVQYWQSSPYVCKKGIRNLLFRNPNKNMMD